ncbi:hypothetical protein D3C80_2079760 [compost metagenome]
MFVRLAGAVRLSLSLAPLLSSVDLSIGQRLLIGDDVSLHERDGFYRGWRVLGEWVA